MARDVADYSPWSTLTQDQDGRRLLVADAHRPLPVACVRSHGPLPRACGAPGGPRSPRLLRLNAAQYQPPPGAEATTDLPPGKAQLLQKAADGLAGPFGAFLDDGKKPDWLIVDTFHYLAAAAAARRGVPSVMFPIFSSASSALWGVPRVSTAVDPKVGASLAQRFLLTHQSCKMVAKRCCVEFDPDGVPLLPAIFGKPFAPLGLLPPPLRSNGGDDTLVSWLDRQPAKSVLYVALGSEAPLSTELVHELASGLELAGTSFLWALRKPSGVPDDAVLPPGFQDRTKHRGLVAMGMVPQTRVLAHDSVGAFLTHCGWSSVIEAMQYGRPLVMLPFFGDQGPIARLMEGRKVGLPVPRNGKDGSSFEREGVGSAVRAVMVEEEGRCVFAANARKLQQVVADTASHERCIDGFLQQLRFYKE
ncbi:unnamed protein product [Triticum turgidum subsp. durum]|uniref:Glycosyltransferase n=1 Tax=Triticum turgidum subsp. durum TaxID=4567 RepID=A0A9R1C4E6_TRITD|nr:unnamed protein product [Triticum turgidum subsp. durum]